MLREIPFDGLVHILAVAGAQVEGDHRRALLGTAGDALVRPDVFGGPGRRGLGPAPRRPHHVGDQAGRVTAIEDPGGLNLAEPLPLGEVAGELAERRLPGRARGRRRRSGHGRGARGDGRLADRGGARGRGNARRAARSRRRRGRAPAGQHGEAGQRDRGACASGDAPRGSGRSILHPESPYSLARLFCRNQRIRRKNKQISFTNSSGCSKAAKWAPLAGSPETRISQLDLRVQAVRARQASAVAGSWLNLAFAVAFAGVVARSAVTITSATSSSSPVLKPSVVSAGVPSRTPEVYQAPFGSLGTELRLVTTPASSSACSAWRPVRPKLAPTSISTRWLSVPPVTSRTSLRSRPSASAWALSTIRQA